MDRTYLIDRDSFEFIYDEVCYTHGYTTLKANATYEEFKSQLIESLTDPYDDIELDTTPLTFINDIFNSTMYFKSLQDAKDAGFSTDKLESAFICEHGVIVNIF